MKKGQTQHNTIDDGNTIAGNGDEGGEQNSTQHTHIHTHSFTSTEWMESAHKKPSPYLNRNLFGINEANVDDFSLFLFSRVALVSMVFVRFPLRSMIASGVLM